MEKLTEPVDAIVFDLDDTLYPESQYVGSGFAAVAGRLVSSDRDAKEILEMLWSAFEQGPRNRVFNTVLRQLGRADDEQVIAELVGVYRCHRPSLELEPAVEQLLTDLRKKYKLGLITDGFLPTQKLKVEALRLEQSFDHIIYTEELGRNFWKPSQRAFEIMAQMLSCEHGRCVYVADNPEKDFLAPNQLHWQTVQVERLERVHNPPPVEGDYKPQFIINQLSELLQLLQSDK